MSGGKKKQIILRIDGKVKQRTYEYASRKGIRVTDVLRKIIRDAAGEKGDVEGREKKIMSLKVKGEMKDAFMENCKRRKVKAGEYVEEKLMETLKRDGEN